MGSDAMSGRAVDSDTAIQRPTAHAAQRRPGVTARAIGAAAIRRPKYGNGRKGCGARSCNSNAARHRARRRATRLVGEEEIKTVRTVLDVIAALMRAMLQNHLLQVEEGLLVRCPLTNLHNRVPCVARHASVTLVAHLILYNVVDLKYLLQYRRCEDLLLDGQLHFDALRVRLRPDEAGIHETDAIQVLDFFQAQRQ